MGRVRWRSHLVCFACGLTPEAKGKTCPRPCGYQGITAVRYRKCNRQTGRFCRKPNRHASSGKLLTGRRAEIETVAVLGGRIGEESTERRRQQQIDSVAAAIQGLGKRAAGYRRQGQAGYRLRCPGTLDFARRVLRRSLLRPQPGTLLPARGPEGPGRLFARDQAGRIRARHRAGHGGSHARDGAERGGHR